MKHEICLLPTSLSPRNSVSGGSGVLGLLTVLPPPWTASTISGRVILAGSTVLCPSFLPRLCHLGSPENWATACSLARAQDRLQIEALELCKGFCSLPSLWDKPISLTFQGKRLLISPADGGCLDLLTDQRSQNPCEPLK